MYSRIGIGGELLGFKISSVYDRCLCLGQIVEVLLCVVKVEEEVGDYRSNVVVTVLEDILEYSGAEECFPTSWDSI